MRSGHDRKTVATCRFRNEDVSNPPEYLWKGTLCHPDLDVFIQQNLFTHD